MSAWLCMNPECKFHKPILDELADREFVYYEFKKPPMVVPRDLSAPPERSSFERHCVERHRVFCGDTLVGYVCSACEPKFSGPV